MEQTLARKQIQIWVELPAETPRLREVTMNVMPSSGVPELTKLAEPFDISVLRNQALLKETLSRVVPDGESYRLSPVDSNQNTYVLHQMLNGYPLFDITLELRISGGQVSAYRQQHAELLSGAAHEDQRVLSALQVVSILADKYLQEGTNIVDVQLGYHGQAFSSETRVLAPYWRVVTERGERFFVHAITGAVE